MNPAAGEQARLDGGKRNARSSGDIPDKSPSLARHCDG